MRSPSDFWAEVAMALRPSLTHYVAPILYDFARIIGARKTVEVGIGEGYASTALAVHAKENESDHYVIDWQAGRERVVKKVEELFDVLMHFIVADAAKEVWSDPPFAPIDLLFVDILATHDEYYQLYTNLTPHLSKKGLIIVHDYFCCEGAKTSVDEYFLWSVDWEVFTFPYDGRPRHRGEKGVCGMALIRRLGNE